MDLSNLQKTILKTLKVDYYLNQYIKVTTVTLFLIEGEAELGFIYENMGKHIEGTLYVDEKNNITFMDSKGNRTSVTDIDDLTWALHDIQ